MGYRLVLTPRAAADADSATDYIRSAAPDAASRWLAGLMDALASLAEMPERCPLAPEADILGAPVRQLLYGKRTGIYRIIFRIEENATRRPVVRVLAIRHCARRILEPADLDEEPGGR